MAGHVHNLSTSEAVSEAVPAFPDFSPHELLLHPSEPSSGRLVSAAVIALEDCSCYNLAKFCIQMKGKCQI